VLVSNWSVGSNATKTLIEHMFDHVRQGADQAEALALAEREVMTETGRQNPYWWAAFMIVGDGAKPLTL
jgi:CHAT domain-containing protein